MTYSKAIVRLLSSSYEQCVSDFPDLHLLNLDKAVDQHENYYKLLEDLGLEVIILDGDPAYPDCCFVEDNAVIHGDNAVVTPMGIDSRRGEVSVIEEVLNDYKTIHHLDTTASLEGGDIIHVDSMNLLICGNSQRTNISGISQLAEKLGCQVRTIEDPNIVHLKSYITYLGNQTMLTTKNYSEHPALQGFEKIIVDKNEHYAANSLNINDTIVLPSGYPVTTKAVKSQGFDTVTLDMSEFQKCEGALTCLSLPF